MLIILFASNFTSLHLIKIQAYPTDLFTSNKLFFLQCFLFKTPSSFSCFYFHFYFSTTVVD